MIATATGSSHFPPIRELVETAWDDLREIVRREIGSRAGGVGEAHVSSVLGDAMVRVLSQRTPIVDGSQLRGLITLFTRRILIDRQRRSRRHRRVLRSIPGPRDPYATTANGLADELADALDSLRRHDERKFMAITLAAMDRLPQDVIASILGTSLATIERDLRFSRAWIASRLHPPAAGPAVVAP